MLSASDPVSYTPSLLKVNKGLFGHYLFQFFKFLKSSLVFLISKQDRGPVKFA
uniref:Uncharacterized protein n=1 Tax=Anguilla anguilla TaxID=7936 RepID=A0A0E9UZB5_ANGAN